MRMRRDFEYCMKFAALGNECVCRSAPSETRYRERLTLVTKKSDGEWSTQIWPSSPLMSCAVKSGTEMYCGALSGAARSMLAIPVPLPKKVTNSLDEPAASSMRLGAAERLQLLMIAPAGASMTSMRCARRSATSSLPSHSGTMSLLEPTSRKRSWSSVSPATFSDAHVSENDPDPGAPLTTVALALAVTVPAVAVTVTAPRPEGKNSPPAEIEPEVALQATSAPVTRRSRQVALAENTAGEGLLRYTVAGPETASEVT